MKKTLKAPVEHVKETAVETEAAVLRIKDAVADTGKNIAEEKAGIKSAHVPPRWAKPELSADAAD